MFFSFFTSLHFFVTALVYHNSGGWQKRQECVKIAATMKAKVFLAALVAATLVSCTIAGSVRARTAARSSTPRISGSPPRTTSTPRR
jgi:hypothetical protein